MIQNIRIKEGSYKIRGKDVDLAGMVFPMVEDFKVGAKGGYVTVDGAAVAGFPQRNIKIALLLRIQQQQKRLLTLKKQMRRQ